MGKNKLALTVFAAATALCFLQARHYAPLLPAKVASHFGASGQPNAWMDRDLFLGLYRGVVSGTALMFGFIFWVLLRAAPAGINLPNKAYWMAAERREGALQFVRGSLLWFGAGTNLLMFDVFGQAFRYDLGQAPGLAHPLASLGAYAGFSIAWTAVFMRRFAKPSNP